MIAIGHPYYARMAVNLAVSLIAHDSTLPIAIAVHGDGFNQLSDLQKSVFKKVIQIPDKHIQGRSGGVDPYKAKLYLDKLTPFDCTLFLDVDMVWNPTHSHTSLMNRLSGVPFTMVNRSRVSTDSSDTLSKWMNLSEVKDKYGFTEVYDVSSELIYFEGKPKVFEAAREIYKKPLVNVSAFGEGTADEAYFMLAIEQLEIKLHDTPFEPTYWEPRYFPRMHNREHRQGFYALSVGGAFTSQHIKKHYDSLNKHYHHSIGIGFEPIELQNKSRIFKERRKI